MSYQIGMDAINLKAPARLAHTEYCDHWPYMRQVTGLDRENPGFAGAFAKAWDLDYIWSTNDGPEPWETRGRTTDMGHTEYMEGGVDRREPKPSPFKTVDEVLSFDAVSEFGLTDFKFLVDWYDKAYKKSQAYYSDAVFSGGYYRTLVSGAIAIFGWDILLEAAAYRDEFTKVLDSIYQQTLHHVKAWSQTSIKVYMCHDDMVWSQGPFMRPEYYRAEIFPRYKELWSILHKAGKKVLFTSDGDFSMFADDIVAAGADALCFEPMVPLKPLVEKYGKTHCLIGSDVDCRTMAFGTKEDIKKEMDSTLKLAMDCPGFIWAVGNHIPANVPLENMQFYIDYLRANWDRK